MSESKQFSCYKCNRHFRRKQNLTAHLNQNKQCSGPSPNIPRTRLQVRSHGSSDFASIEDHGQNLSLNIDRGDDDFPLNSDDCQPLNFDDGAVLNDEPPGPQGFLNSTEDDDGPPEEFQGEVQDDELSSSKEYGSDAMIN